MGFFSSVRRAFGFEHRDLPDEAPSTGEVATRKVAAMTGLMQWLPNPDLILRKTGKRIEHLSKLLYDDEIFSSVQVIHAALREVDFELKHDGSNPEAVEVIEEWLDAYDWERLDNEIIEGRLYGYQPLEIMWSETMGTGPGGQFWRPADLVGKPPQWFAYDDENHLTLRRTKTSRNPEALKQVAPEKFIVARHKPSYNNPYGQAVLSRCWWPYTFKKGDLRFWITMAEKYGMPIAVGKHPPTADQDDVDTLLDQLQAMVQDSVAAIPDDESVELLESPFRASSSDLYQDIIDWAEASMQKVILSSEMVTSAGEYGTQAQADPQIEKVAGKVLGAVARLKMQVVNELIDYIWHFNFEGQEGKPEYGLKEDREASVQRAERDTQPTNQGVRFTEQYYQREYGLEEDDFELQEPQQGGGSQASAGPPGFARRDSPVQFADGDDQGGQAALDALIESLASDDERNQAMMEELLAEPMRLIQEGEDPDVVMEELARAYPDLDASALEERLRSLFFAAEVWGRLSEEQEAEA
jgi:phage gp29-like protein